MNWHLLAMQRLRDKSHPNRSAFWWFTRKPNRLVHEAPWLSRTSHANSSSKIFVACLLILPTVLLQLSVSHANASELCTDKKIKGEMEQYALNFVEESLLPPNGDAKIKARRELLFPADEYVIELKNIKENIRNGLQDQCGGDLTITAKDGSTGSVWVVYSVQERNAKRERNVEWDAKRFIALMIGNLEAKAGYERAYAKVRNEQQRESDRQRDELLAQQNAAQERQTRMEAEQKASEVKQRRELEHAANVLRKLALQEGPKFSTNDPSVWTYSESLDKLTGSMSPTVVSVQSNDNGVQAEITGSCSDKDIKFTSLIVDENGKPTVNVVRDSDGAATVRIRVNNQVSQGVAPMHEFENQYDVITIKGPYGEEYKSWILPISELDYDKIWAAAVEFTTTSGKLYISIPVFNGEIKKLMSHCTGIN